MKAHSFFLLAVVCVPTFSSAQNVQPSPPSTVSTVLTLEQVIASVERHFPMILAAEHDTRAANAELLAAEGSFDPQWRTRVGGAPVGYYNPLTIDSAITQPTQLWGAQLFAGWRYGLGQSYTGIPTYDGKNETNTLGEIRAGLNVPLWRNGPIDRGRANIQRAQYGVVIANTTAQQQHIDAQRISAQRYWDWVAAGRRFAIANDLFGIARARDAGLQERVLHGDLPDFERIDNQRAMVQREGAVVAARRLVEQAAIELSMYVRDTNGQPRVATLGELPDVFPEPVPIEATCARNLEQQALLRRPEPQRIEAQRNQFRVERDLAANQQRPAIDLSIAASHDFGDGSPSREGPVVEGGIVVDIPILNRAATGRQRSASASMARAEEQRRFALDRVSADIRDARSALDAAAQRVTFARRELTVSRDLAAGERERFTHGEGTLLIVNLRELTAAEAAVREVDALLDWQRSVIAWRASTASLQSGPAPCITPQN
jgi:outer membrane protein, heavy metal efflux system